MSSQLRRVQAAVIEGRAQSPRFIQKQLTNLHEALIKHSETIKSALKKDSDLGDAEIEVEFFLTLDAVRQAFLSLDFSTALMDEYSLAISKDNSSRRVAYGCVYVVPSSFSSFYSTIVPLAAAIRAGNCVILEIKQTLAELNSVLKHVLTTALEKDTFCISEKTPNEPFLSKYCIILDGQPASTPVTTTCLISTPSYRTVAIVDRTSNITDAAHDLTRSRFAFGGQSPYAPDLVLVNEFVLDDFCAAVTQSATKLLAGSIETQQKNSSRRKNKTESRGLVLESEDESLVTLVSGWRGSVVLAQKRDSKLLHEKIREAVLLIHPFRSLDDAIDTSNSSETPLLATYLFADLKSAKYLSQFINANISCTNGVPADLLVGPPAPVGFATSIQPRYAHEMFSSPRPEFITFSDQSKTLAKVLDHDDSKEKSQISKKAQESLPSMEEPAGKAIGFFEQGLITGGTLALMSLVTMVVFSKIYLVPAVLTLARR